MTVITVTATAVDGRKVNLTAKQAAAIETMTNTRKGGCGSVTGYRPSPASWEIVPTMNIQLITHFSTTNLYKRRLEALETVKFEHVKNRLAADEKLGNMTMQDCIDLFNTRKQMMMDSLQKTLDGDRSDAHRQAHDRCYAYIGDVKVHLKTIDGMVDGKKRKVPVEDNDGAVFVESIMIPYLELNVTEVTKGKRKVKNSGAPVRMSNLIEGCLNKRSVVYKTLSLKQDNFESFRVDRQEFLAEDVATFGHDIIYQAA